MKESTEVSVIIPTHNHAHFLPKTLSSVREQAYDNYEVIVVDNGSTDDTRRVVENIKWQALRYVYQEDSGSAAGSRNTGIRLAKGEYIAFLDSDDVWYKDKLTKVMDIFKQNPEIGLVCNDEYCRKGDKLVSYLKYGPDEPGMFEKLLFFGNRLSGSGTTVKREWLIRVGCFDESKKYIHVEDYDLWLKLAKAGCRFYFLNQPLGEFILHDSNLSNDITTQMANARQVMKKHFFVYENRYVPKFCYLFIKAYMRSYYSQILRYAQGTKGRKG
ncbi:MAG: glycosyltransferase [Candidatus Omnitrophica bacterium]|nr:glycosyltransferase [Candidatus Omnitrophota bacterium]